MKIKPIKEAVVELKNVLYSIAILASFTDGLVVLLISVLVLVLLSLSWIYALVPFIFYSAIHIYGNLSKLSLKTVEDKVPDIREQLRTAADNTDKDNEIVNSLNTDVLGLMRKVRVSYFIDFRRLFRQFAVLAILSFLIIFLAHSDLRLLDISNVADELSLPNLIEGVTGDGGEGGGGLGGGDAGGLSNFTDIYGNASIADIGTQELQLQINPVFSEIDINDVNDVEDKDFTSEFPDEIKAVSDVSPEEEKISKQHKEIVKNYFKEISRG